ncbi:MAG: nicotinate (nicotinamide) nucleotide adenylyltransferase [Candidatus Pelagibacter sp.]
MKKIKKNKIGILGGTFDPAHIGHIKVSKEAKKKFRLNKIFWVITKKNPFKKKSFFSLKKRINHAKKINVNNKFIKIYFFEDKIKSNKTIDLMKFLKNRYKKTEFFFIMGADNLINFHKWKKWNKIAEISKILVFNRLNYKSKSLKSISFKKLNKKRLQFINFKKVNISSSQLRKI